MNKNSPNTEEILDAIKNMMSEKSVRQNEELPKDVIELTNPIDEEVKKEDEKIDILELSNPINDKKIISFSIENKISLYFIKNRLFKH